MHSDLSQGESPQNTRSIDRQRRRLIGAISAAIAVPGCCCMRPFPAPRIGEIRADATEVGLLSPNIVNKTLTKSVYCVDVHAHFFNASDVTVKGYLAGPVAHSTGGIQGRLIKLLAPLADELGAIAPQAKEEYDRLDRLASDVRLKTSGQVDLHLESLIANHRQGQSRKFYDLMSTPKGRPFVEEYNKAQREARVKGLNFGNMEAFNELSLANAMSSTEIPLGTLKAKSLRGDSQEYGDGVLAFVGYMLSDRWENLYTYRKAFSVHENAIGVDRVLGSLVDFDRWLECAPRSAHEDQMKLHALMSKLSSGYMLPLISYNPWTDVADNGRSLSLVVKAVTEYGFVGAKVYPANGFRPWGNTDAQGGAKLPSPKRINEALQVFWDKCIELNIPVMAHAGQSMGKDNAHDLLAGPDAWRDLVNEYGAHGKSPLVNLGHFGGDTGGPMNNWTSEMAKVMMLPHGDKVFGDLGYWSELQCDVVKVDRCKKAADRLSNALNVKLNAGERIADRVMFGSDWLMLSRQPDWPDYAAGLFTTVKGIAPDDVANIFGKNAVRCFGAKVDSV